MEYEIEWHRTIIQCTWAEELLKKWLLFHINKTQYTRELVARQFRIGHTLESFLSLSLLFGIDSIETVHFFFSFLCRLCSVSVCIFHLLLFWYNDDTMKLPLKRTRDEKKAKKKKDCITCVCMSHAFHSHLMAMGTSF